MLTDHKKLLIHFTANETNQYSILQQRLGLVRPVMHSKHLPSILFDDFIHL